MTSLGNDLGYMSIHGASKKDTGSAASRPPFDIPMLRDGLASVTTYPYLRLLILLPNYNAPKSNLDKYCNIKDCLELALGL